nr:MAG TPA: hypothetical protein [Caudoviricetes sp.]
MKLKSPQRWAKGARKDSYWLGCLVFSVYTDMRKLTACVLQRKGIHRQQARVG